MGIRESTFAFSGDTAWTDALITASAGADVLAFEDYPFDRPVRFHLDYRTLRLTAPVAAGSGRVS